MENLGLGVMINMLSGEDGGDKVAECLGEKITAIRIEEDALCLGFNGRTLKLWDDGQSCCECRYMTTDDDLNYFVGSTLQGVEIKDGPTQEDDYGDPHETQFLVITTSLGVFTVVTHNEHNGYYGGFYLRAGWN